MKEFEVWAETKAGNGHKLSVQIFVKARNMAHARQLAKEQFLKEFHFDVYKIPDGDMD